MDRYSRQTLFPPIGEEGQKSLFQKHVLIIGVGTLGTLSAESLVRAGVGQITIVDRDYVEWSNLQRQHLYTEMDAEERLPKVIAAKRRLQAINSDLAINAHILDVTPVELEWLVNGVDLLLDATDNFDIRMMMNDIAMKHRLPWIYGSCVGSYGVTYTIRRGETPCLHCILGKVPIGGPTCDTAGIIQPAASQVVVHQTTEALKLLTGNEAALRGTFLSFDVWENERLAMKVDKMKKDDCPSCGKEASYPFLSFEEQTKSAILCGRDAVQIRPPKLQDRNLQEIANRLKKLFTELEINPFLLSCRIGKERLVLFKDGRALIHGTNDLDYAKTLYHRYLS